jgi:hypothetical protein
VNVNDAKTILRMYRPGTADAEDPQIAEALALAAQTPELARWLEEQTARHARLRGQFRQIPVPAGLKEQILAETAAPDRVIHWSPRRVLAMAAALVFLAALAALCLPRRPKDDTLDIFQHRMAGIALRSYGMDLATNNSTPIRAFLAQRSAPADYVLPPGLKKAEVIGCAIEGWQNTKVSMLCFRTGQPLRPGQASDLWLFVVDRTALKDPPAPGDPPRILDVNRLTAAVWTLGDRVYLLGVAGNPATLQRFL